jgi:hypothetical protein
VRPLFLCVILHNLGLSCSGLAPAWLCSHLDMLLYLVPSAALAIVIAILSSISPLFFIFTLAGTICHELAHFFVGLLTGAAPTGLSIVPRKVIVRGRLSHWRLGSVTLSRVNWANAAPAALAPLLLLLLPLAVAWWRTRAAWHFGPIDLIIAALLAPQWLSFWPSGADWRIAVRSWPWLLIIGAALAACLAWH